MRTSHRRMEELIRERSKTITDEELFSSEEYAVYLTDISEAVSGRYGRNLRVKLVCDDSPNAFAARTDNSVILINPLNRVVTSLSSRPMKALSMIGFCAHELGHLLYTDFPSMVEYQKQLINGCFWPEEPEVSPELEESKQEIISALQSGDKAMIATIVGAAHSFLNILEDVYIEERMCEEYPGQFRTGILLNSEQGQKMREPIALQVLLGLEPLKLMQNMILSYCRVGEVDNLGGYTGEYLDALNDCIPVLDEVKTIDNGAKQKKAASRILIRLWPYVKQSVEGTRRKMLAQEELGKLVDKFVKELLKGNVNPPELPNGKTSAIQTENVERDTSDVSEERRRIKLLLKNGDEELTAKTEQDLGKVFRMVVRKSAEKEAEQELALELQEQAESINYGANHDGIIVKVHRELEIPSASTERYYRLYPKIKPISKRLQASISSILKDKRSGGRLDGLLMGKKFDTHKLYRKDGRHFYNLRLPEETELAVALLVDESGSMSYQNRIRYAREAAITIYDFCTALNLPVMVYGHDSDGSQVNLYAYAEFDSVDGRDKFRMAGISAKSENRDGLALRYVAERLITRPESRKLLIIISDGLPSAKNYGGKPAEQELLQIKKEFSGKGVTLFAAAIGDDKDTIQRIYGDSYLDISELNNLPMNLSKLITKFLK